MTRLELYNVIAPLISLVTGIDRNKVILADQNAPAPSGQYITVEPTQSLTQRGQANVISKTSQTPDSVDVDVRPQMISECSVNVYRGDARNQAQKLVQMNKIPTVQEALFRARVGFNRAESVNNLSALQSNEIEQRAQVSLYLMFEFSNEIVINSINSVQLVTEDESSNILSDITVEQ